MLFETNQQKAVKINGSSAGGHIQKSARPINGAASAGKAPLKPLPPKGTVAGKQMPRQNAPVKSAGYIQNKKAPVATANITPRRIYSGTAARPLPKAPSPGYYKPPGKSVMGTPKPNRIQPGKTSYYRTADTRIMQPTRQANYNRRTSLPLPATSVSKPVSRKAYRGPLVVRRGQQIPGRRVYYPGRLINQPTYRSGYANPPVGASVPANAPGGYVPGYGYCTPRAPVQQVPSTPVYQPATTPAPGAAGVRKPACHTCGLHKKGCTTLSRFAFNTSQLNAFHKKQIRDVALRIVSNHNNAVVVTGHTDTSGTEKYNNALGARRAGAVVRELRKQLSVLKPNAHKNVFWKIVTKGETQPISKTDAAANRRVHLCIRKVKLAA
jgi:outer membrane protein OmpA-like peptidoglycan-associated protein